MKLRDGTEARDSRLGRLVQFDEKSRSFPIRTLVAPQPLRSQFWPCAKTLDQGTEGQCVGFAWTHEAIAEPEVLGDLTDENARTLYRRAQELDEWAGSEYSGTSVLAGVKAAQELGWYESYHWAFSIDELALGIGYKGPAVLGIPWHESMFAPGPDGFLKIEGDAVGGHAILCNAVDVEARIFRLHNSWGPSWGLAGECLIHWDDLAKLLDNDGEACLPTRNIALSPAAADQS